MRSLLLALCALIGFSGSALAAEADWLLFCGSDEVPANGLEPGQWACQKPRTSGAESDMLKTDRCAHVHGMWGADEAGNANDATLQGVVYACIVPTDASGDDPTAVGWSATGICDTAITLAGTGYTRFTNLATPYLYVLPTLTDDDPRVIVWCE